MISSSPLHKRSRIFYVDVIRTWASVLVVASHIFANVCAGMNTYSLPTWWFYNLADSIIRPCAALFVMISGALLLSSPREELYLKAVWRRCHKLALPFFVWSILYAFYNSRLENQPFHVGHALLDFFQGPTEYHLWFMYVILALYVVAPFLRRLVQSATPSELKGMLGVWFAFITLQFIFPDWAGDGSGVIFLNYGGYFVLGYILEKSTYFSKKVFRLFLAAVILVLINAFATYCLTAHRHGVLDEKFYGGATPLVALYGAALFLVMKHIDYDRWIGGAAWLRKAVIYFSKESYNIYLMHALFIWMFMKGQFGFELSLDTWDNPVVGVPVTWAAVLAVSLGFCFVVRKIPVLSRLLIISSNA